MTKRDRSKGADDPSAFEDEATSRVAPYSSTSVDGVFTNAGGDEATLKNAPLVKKGPGGMQWRLASLYPRLVALSAKCREGSLDDDERADVAQTLDDAAAVIRALFDEE